MVGVLAGLAHDPKLLVGREGDVEHLDLLVAQQLLPGVVDLGHAALPCRLLRVGRRTRGNGDGLKAGVVVREQLNVLHDEAGADCPDLVGLLRWRGLVVQREVYSAG